MNHLIIGPVPPPLGGISVYISRLSRRLREQGHSVRNIDFEGAGAIGRTSALARIVFDPRPVSIDLHAFDFSAMGAALLRPFRKSVSYMDHNTLLYGRKLNGLRAWILKRFLARADCVSFVSAEGLKFYHRAGFTFRRAVVQNAYLPPPPEDEKKILDGYSRDTQLFIRNRNPLLVVNASQVVFREGIDLYGLDLSVDLVLRLRQEFPQIGLLLAVANPAPNSGHLRSLAGRIEQAGAAENFHLLTGQQELWPVFRQAALLLRPTTGDGFAVSVAEALDLGCPVLASDAVERPASAALFRSRDLEDFVNRAREILLKAIRPDSG